MPKLIDENIIQLEFADLWRRVILDRPATPAPRAAGYHLSGVLAPIARHIGVLKKDEPLEEEMPNMIALGIMWEEFAASFYPDLIWQPGAVSVQTGGRELWMTCDGLSTLSTPFGGHFGKHAVQGREFKLTRKYVRKGEEFLKEWLWMHQARGYGYGYDCLLWQWDVMHIYGGDKEFGHGPVYKQYVVEFTPQECEQTIRMVGKHLHLAQPEPGIAA